MTGDDKRDWMIFAIEDGVLHWRGAEIRLTRQQATALHLLCLNYQHWMSKADLAAVLWPAALPDHSDKLVERIMYGLASKVITDRTRIECRRDYGYALFGDIDWVHVEKVVPDQDPPYGGPVQLMVKM